MTLELEVSERTLAAIRATPEGMERAQALLEAAFADELQAVACEGEELDELKTALTESDADIRFGRVMSCDEQDAHLATKFPWLKQAHEKAA